MLNPFYGQMGKHPKKELKGTSKIVLKTMLQLRLPIFQSDMLAFDPLQRILQNLWDLVPSRIRGPKTNFYGIIWLGLGPLYFETSRKIDNNVPTCSQEVQHTKYNTQKTSWGSKLQTCTLPPSPSGPKQPQLPWPFESSLPPSGTRCFRPQHHHVLGGLPSAGEHLAEPLTSFRARVLHGTFSGKSFGNFKIAKDIVPGFWWGLALMLSQTHLVQSCWSTLCWHPGLVVHEGSFLSQRWMPTGARRKGLVHPLHLKRGPRSSWERFTGNP